MGVSNNITATLNFIALLASIPIIVSGIWLASKADNECTHYFRWPVVILGVLILLVCLAGFVGAYWNRQGLLAFYLICMAILIALLLILLVFAFIVTRSDGAYPVQGRGYQEYRLDGFSQWLRDHVTNSKNWGKIRTCLADSDVCAKLTQNYMAADQFYSAHISPLQVSFHCLFLLWPVCVFANATGWRVFISSYISITNIILLFIIQYGIPWSYYCKVRGHIR